MDLFIGIEARLMGLIRGLLGIVMILMVILNLVNAAGRYGGTPIFTGADELLVFGMIWIVMIGAIVTTRDRKHLSIDVFPQRLTNRLRLALNIIIGAITTGLSTFVAFHSLEFIKKIAAIGQTSMGLSIPMVIPHLAVFIGFSGIALVSAILAITDSRTLLIES
tara:strand:- start:226 stop:717 length:492 start_codon:yes stop_codon:yes gene_type:complete